MNACTWGYAPSRHPHTSKIAFGYLESRTSNFRPSSRQHFRQSATWAADTENRAKSSHELQVKDNVLNPKLLHSSGLSSAPNARCKRVKRTDGKFIIPSWSCLIPKIKGKLCFPNFTSK